MKKARLADSDNAVGAEHGAFQQVNGGPVDARPGRVLPGQVLIPAPYPCLVRTTIQAMSRARLIYYVREEIW